MACLLFHFPFIFISSSTCFHVCFDRPLQLCSSNSKAVSRTSSSSFLKKRPLHRILLALVIISQDSCTSNLFTNSSVFFRSISFTAHITLSILFKIAFFFSLKHRVSLLYNSRSCAAFVNLLHHF